MPAHTISLVIADVDGTLVSKEKILTQRAIDSIHKMEDVGIRFAITSGRPPMGMAMLIDPLKISQPVAAFNGGGLIKPDLKTVVRENFLPLDVVKKALQLILDHKMDAWMYTDKEWFVRDVNAPHVAREQWTVKFAPIVTKDINSITTRVAKIVGCSDDLELVALRKRCLARRLRRSGFRSAFATLLFGCDLAESQQGRSGAGLHGHSENSGVRNRNHRRHAERREHVQKERRKHRHGTSERRGEKNRRRT